jgi:hypothetical protein
MDPTWERRDGRQYDRVVDREECTRQLRLLAEWRVRRQKAIRASDHPVSSVVSRRVERSDRVVRPNR